MTKTDKLIVKILTADSDRNIPFSDLLRIMFFLGFEERQKGSHRIFFKEGISEIVNLQVGKDGKAKAYQVKQVRTIIQKYKLYLRDES